MRVMLYCLFAVSTAAFGFSDEPKPIRALYVTGGCCHDYTSQKNLITEGISFRSKLPIEWTIVHAGGTGTRFDGIENSIYQNKDWAKGFDVVVHNECFSHDNDPAYVERVLAPHRAGLGAVAIHCAMHTFSTMKTDEYREFLGVASFNHGPQHPLDVKNLQPENPIMKGFPAIFKTGDEELYAIRKVWPGVTVLATAADKKKENGEWVTTEKEHPVIWQHTYGKGRVFATTLAHHGRTMENPAYLEMLTRGFLWSCGKLE